MSRSKTVRPAQLITPGSLKIAAAGVFLFHYSTFFCSLLRQAADGGQPFSFSLWQKVGARKGIAALGGDTFALSAACPPLPTGGFLVHRCFPKWRSERSPQVAIRPLQRCGRISVARLSESLVRFRLSSGPIRRCEACSTSSCRGSAYRLSPCKPRTTIHATSGRGSIISQRSQTGIGPGALRRVAQGGDEPMARVPQAADRCRRGAVEH